MQKYEFISYHISYCTLVVQVEKVLRSELQIGIKEKYNRTEEQGLKEAWDTVQIKVNQKRIDKERNSRQC